MKLMRTVITGTGCYIPTVIKTNKDFSAHNFYSEANQVIGAESSEVARKFQAHILGGIKWALGLEKGDATPNPDDK